jgi:glycolate oxidase iron-sulfur subunit
MLNVVRLKNVPYGGSVPEEGLAYDCVMTLLLMQQNGTVKRSTSDDVLADADACVSCGLCLPHCPTYRLADNEAESPRGRIAIVRGLLSGQLPADDMLLGHLDNCLLCRNCEKVCPAQVKYEQIIEGVRAELREKRIDLRQGNKYLVRLLASAIRYRRSMRPLASMLAIVQHSGLAWLAAKSKLPGISKLGRMATSLPRFSLWPVTRKYFPAHSDARGTVALFTGCLSEQGEKEVLLSAVSVLNRLGYNVRIPKQQSCCGANDFHEGSRKAGLELVENNLAVFSRDDPEAVISVATGCGAMLGKYTEVAGGPGRTKENNVFSGKTFDILEFLMSIDWPDNVSLANTSGRVYLHEPCSSYYAYRNTTTVKALLNRVPGIDICEVEAVSTCCGASGMKYLLNDEKSGVLGAELAQSVRENKPGYVLSANLTCRSHLQNMVSDKAIHFMHPVQFIDQHLSVQTDRSPA